MRLSRLWPPACALGVVLLACQAPPSSMGPEGDAVAGGDVAPAAPAPVDDRDPPSMDLGGDVPDPTAIASGGSAGEPSGVEGGGAPTGGDGGAAGDASKPPITCPASSYEMTLTRTLRVFYGYGLSPGAGGSVNVTGTLRQWRPDAATMPRVYYFNLKVAGESGSNFTLISWTPATISATGMTFSWGSGINNATAFPFTGCYTAPTDMNSGSLRFDNTTATVHLSVTCNHLAQTGPTLKDRRYEITTWSGKGVAACVAP